MVIKDHLITYISFNNYHKRVTISIKLKIKMAKNFTTSDCSLIYVNAAELYFNVVAPTQYVNMTFYLPKWKVDYNTKVP